MIVPASVLTQIGIYILYILLPILALYIVYLVVTKAFNDMGFSSAEAILIVFACFILGYGILDEFIGISFSNIYLFTHGKWEVGINTGGAIIPIVLSIYLMVKNKIRLRNFGIGILIVSVITYLVTEPNADRGIVSKFPFWILPAIAASLVSIFLYWKNKQKAAPLAYISGTLGVLIGADLFHLIELLNLQVTTETTRHAVIGGASVLDMIFITGILAVIVDGILIYQEKRKPG